MKRLGILGASGHGKVVADTALAAGWDEIIFFDDAWPARQHNVHWPVAGDTSVLLAGELALDGVIVGIGNNRVRQEKTQQLRLAGLPVVSVFHPGAHISRFASIGYGSVAFAGACVQVDTICGIACVINTGASVDHDCLLGEAVHVSPGSHLAGSVHVGERSWIGIGACVRQQIIIGSDVLIAAGAAVVSHVGNGLTVAGVPARELSKPLQC